MKWIGIVLGLIPVVIKLMKVAEELFDDVPDSGEDKKRMVMETVSAMLAASLGLGVDPKLVAKIEKAVSWLIDAICIFLFKSRDADVGGGETPE